MGLSVSCVIPCGTGPVGGRTVSVGGALRQLKASGPISWSGIGRREEAEPGTEEVWLNIPTRLGDQPVT